MEIYKRHCLKNHSICTCIYHRTLTTHPDSSPLLSAVPCARITSIGSCTVRFFSKRLQAHGYKSDHIKPLFIKAIARAQCYSGPTDRATNDENTVILLHLPFHPNDPPSPKIQQAWRDTNASPKYHMPLPHMRNPKSRGKCNIERMIIAYRRPMNLGNLLSHHNLNTNPTAQPVSSYYPYG